MNNRFIFAALVASFVSLTACSKPPSGDVGLVDVPRLTSNWPKFLNYQNQLNADMNAIRNSHESDAQKNRDLAGLQYRFQTNQTELTNNVHDAAQQVQKLGLEVTPLSMFTAKYEQPPALMLGFASCNPAELRRGVSVLATALRSR